MRSPDPRRPCHPAGHGRRARGYRHPQRQDPGRAGARQRHQRRRDPRRQRSRDLSRRDRRSPSSRARQGHRAPARAGGCRARNRGRRGGRRHDLRALSHGHGAVRGDLRGRRVGDAGGRPHRLQLPLHHFDRSPARRRSALCARARGAVLQDFHEQPGRGGQAPRPARHRRRLSISAVRGRCRARRARVPASRRTSRPPGCCAIA